MNTRKMTAAFESAFTRPACSPNGDDPARWLTDKIRHYESEVSRLEQELTHTRILLKGHQTWLADIQRMGAK